MSDPGTPAGSCGQQHPTSARLDDASRAPGRAAARGRASGNGPIRTCIGCRRRCRDIELLRVVVMAGAVVPDTRRRLPGRGAWVHPSAACVAAARKRRAFGRALRTDREPDATPVERYVSAARRPD